MRDGVLRVYTTTAPVDGEANKAVIELVAKALRIPKSKIAVVRGQTSRDKVLSISGLSQAELDLRSAGL